MNLEDAELYRALAARDARFDGLFFVGVSTTGIYCRPVCSARTPRAANCAFYSSAAAAEAAGYRPCLVCRPELAPGRARVDAAGRLADAAVRRIEAGASPAEVARTLGITDRHLRRVVVAHYGVPPVALAQTGRLLAAKRLLTDTRMPVGEVALASGFASVRRMNALFRERYRMSPSDLRKTERAPEETIHLRVPYRPPYAWEAMRDHFAARALPGVEAIVDGRLVRAVEGGWFSVGPSPLGEGRVGVHALDLEVSASLASSLPRVVRRVGRMFDVEAEPLAIAEVLGDLASEPGMRLPGAWDPFEVGVRAILGQQISVAGARTVAGRLAAAYGTPVEGLGVSLAFPSAARLAALEPEEVVRHGMVMARAATVVRFARAVAEGLSLRYGDDPERAMAELVRIKGIGPWTAHVIAMRALGHPDAFPAADLGVMRALNAATPAEAVALAERYRPWRAYATIHLWRTLPSPSSSPRRKARDVAPPPPGDEEGVGGWSNENP